jgi:threonine/homoserine/homoserine lactone efflux protein
VVAISPLNVIPAILLLFTTRPLANASLFLAGFIAGVGAVLALLVVFAGAIGLSQASGHSSWVGPIKAIVGAYLVVAAIRKFRGRPRTLEDAAMPKWMDGISSFQPRKSAAVGLVVGAANPKNIAMALGASLTVASASLTSGNQAIVMAIYTLIAVLGVLAPLIVVLVMGDRSHAILDSWKTWLAQNNAAVMSVLFAVFGVVLISKGISGL